MSFFENIGRVLFGDSEEELERIRKVENIQSNQFRLIREHFGYRKNIENILNEITRRGVWMIFADYEMRGDAHLRYPYFQQPVTGDITVDNRGNVYQYAKPKKGDSPLEQKGHTDKTEMWGCYIINFRKLEELIIPSEVLDQGASKLPGESLADYYKRPGVTAKEEYKKRQNQNRK